jgi:hypothetical protein
MTLLSIAGLCTFALIAWLLWLEHREELNALAHSRNGDRLSTEDEVRGVQSIANEAPEHRSGFCQKPS